MRRVLCFFHYFFVATEGNRGYMHGNGGKRSFHSLEVASAMEISLYGISVYMTLVYAFHLPWRSRCMTKSGLDDYSVDGNHDIHFTTSVHGLYNW
jgi:hypothetical protein